jgi:hypothetical protein
LGGEVATDRGALALAIAVAFIVVVPADATFPVTADGRTAEVRALRATQQAPESDPKLGDTCYLHGVFRIVQPDGTKEEIRSPRQEVPCGKDGLPPEPGPAPEPSPGEDPSPSPEPGPGTDPTPEPGPGTDPTPEPGPGGTPTPDPTPPRAPGKCDGTAVAGGANLASVAGQRPAGTTFCIAAGSFSTGTVRAESGDSFIGAGVSKTLITFTGTTGFNLDGTTGVEIAHLSAGGASGTKESCGKECGRGVHRGVKAHFHDARFHHNAQAGIGGNLAGAVVERVEIDHNGTSSFLGCCGGGIKGGTAFTIRDSHVHHNIGNGVWCDAGCFPGGVFTVSNNRIEYNSKDGVRYENSPKDSSDNPAAHIFGNVVVHNVTGAPSGHSGGIIINSAWNAEVNDNVLGSTGGGKGIEVGGSRNQPKNINVHHNRMNGDSVVGCGGSGLTCTQNN